jgi:hypothetical protein
MEPEIENIMSKYAVLLINGANLPELCTLTSLIMENPVVILIPTKTIIAHSSDFSSDLVEEFTSSGKHMTLQENEAEYTAFNEALATGKAGIYHWRYSRYNHLSCGCIYKKNHVAMLDCPIINDMPDRRKMDIFEFAAQVFVIALQINGYISENIKQPMEEFLTVLLNDTENQKKYVRKAYYYTIPRYQLVWLAPNKTNLSVMQLFSQLRDFCAAQRNWWCVEHDDGFVLLLDAAENAALGQLHKAVGQHLQICVSDEFGDMKEIRDHLQLAQLALFYVNKSLYSDSSSDSIVYVDSYKAIIAYTYALENSKLNIFDSNILRTIRQYDKDHNSQYIETLKACYRYRMDFDEISRKLYIHKNTIRYRVKQLKELFDVDFQDIPQTVNLYLTLLVKEYEI